MEAKAADAEMEAKAPRLGAAASKMVMSTDIADAFDVDAECGFL